MTVTAKPIILYSNSSCPYVQRALIALYECDLDHEAVEIPLPNKPDWYLELNPEGKVPALKYGDDILVESLVIAEFFSDLAGGKLLPKDPLKKAQARYLIEFFGAKFLPLYYSILGNTDTEKAKLLEQQFVENLKRLNKLLSAQSTEGPFYFGEEFSLVEAAVAPFLSRFTPMAKIGGIQIPKIPELQRYHQWSDAVGQRESFIKSSLSSQELYESCEALALKYRG
ncbi:glutathione S-transferase [Basidiobolus meristosporus CBS 931.73]|uniref:Glutathione S-transferase n=1 Tax=Basidiobolus meristosporus CBS 931.73 TaxID=1314790 RepID=A0A1Y1ZCL7_9FUNG|nr:glutathione S-transferase [Basidiobolus meristosporus CBS 931.73]|eukprot:ORY08001.1 glutathione S-transferase [Basidiobolus meristosporus CBS 931.73]